jgi:hypothetical protein
MAICPALPYATTLSAALDASSTTIKTTASTGYVKGWYGVIGKEVVLFTKCDTTSHTHEIKRGMKGTAAAKHASGAPIYAGPSTSFGQVTPAGVEVAGYVGDFGAPTLPLGSRYVDPNTGYEYLLCKSASAHDVGDWVYLTAAHVSTAMAVVCKGRTGIVVEAPGAADKLHWVAVVGTFYGQSISATTAGMIVTNVKGVAVGTTCDLGAYIVSGAVMQAAPTTGILTTGLLYAYFTINNPWVAGQKITTTA